MLLHPLKSARVQVFRRLDEDLSASADSRRLKSAKARNRGYAVHRIIAIMLSARLCRVRIVAMAD